MKSHLPMTREQRLELRRLVRRVHADHGLVMRARAVLALRLGMTLGAVAESLSTSVRWVSKWKARWMASPFVDSLRDAERSGRPAVISVAVKCELVRLACDRPPDKAFRSVWTQQSLAQALWRETGHRVSRSTVQRVLSAEGLRPHRVRQWLHSPDPNFREKVKSICKLYLEPPAGSTVICVDEKPMQALARKHPASVQPDASLRREFEYIRRGTCCLLAGFNIRTGEVTGRVVNRRTGPTLVSFMEMIAAKYPRGTIYVVWDNLNIHLDGQDERWTTFNRRHRGRFRFVYTPLHASWVNQVEIWFSILQRRVLRHGSFTAHSSLRAAVLGFVKLWNRAEAHPFHWTFTGRFEQSSAAKRAA